MEGVILEYLEFLSFLTIFHALCEFNGNYRQYLKFELQVCDSLAPKIYKNHKNVVYHDSTQLHRFFFRKMHPLDMNGHTDDFGSVLRKIT